MPSEKRLNSVCHSIAHHAVSGLSWIHPHLGRACRQAGLSGVSIDLLADNPCPKDLRCRRKSPLRVGLGSVQEKFAGILQSEGFSVDDLTSAVLEFEFPPDKDDYWSLCTSTTVTASGRQFRHKLDAVGKTLDT
jgi:hypothetical protein